MACSERPKWRGFNEAAASNAAEMETITFGGSLRNSGFNEAAASNAAEIRRCEAVDKDGTELQ